MPGARTLGYLVGRVREETQEWLNRDASGRVRLINGYTSEQGLYPDGTSITRLLNLALTDLATTGFNKCDFNVTLTVGVSEYLLTRQIHEIETAYILDTATGQQYPLYKTSAPALDAQWAGPMWRKAKASRPIYYYPNGTRGFGVWATPLSSTLQAVFHADALVRDMQEPGDVPAAIYDDTDTLVIDTDAGDGLAASALPEEYHEALVLYAAWRICRMQLRGDDPTLKDQTAMLAGEWKEAKTRLAALVNSRQEPDVQQLTLRTPRGYRWRGLGGSAFGITGFNR